MTKIFIWKYRAFPIFVENPIFPGFVIRIDDEKPYLRTCYKKQRPGNYVGTQDYIEGLNVSSNVDAKIGGVVLSKRIADVQAGGVARFSNTSSITVTPLSLDRSEPDGASLQDWDKRNQKCSIIDGLLSGIVPEYFLVEEVLHGKVNFTNTVYFSSNINAQAKSDLLVKISKAFAINMASIDVSTSSATFAVSASPDKMTLAIRPAMYNIAELSRITYFMRGERGANLEIAVEAALRERDLNFYDRAEIRIRNLLGDEIANRTQWAQKMVYGEKMYPAADLANVNADFVDFHAVAVYAAAMESLRK
ncbi:hypothetical protein [Phyllobacterium brassicacearum]|uniref:hypothetical protein n=1 Tax=Phyllobacterium brassicacearum TaxID=314235 RepID=UPI00105CBB43|nr:hypothetical protein [Phyllobacterium brassicacearum]